MANNSERFQCLMRIYLSNKLDRSNTREICSDIIGLLVRVLSQRLMPPNA